MSKLTRRLAPLTQLRRPSEVARFAEVLAVAASVPLAVRLPLPRLASVLSVATTTRGRPASPSAEEIDRIVARVEAARHLGAPVVGRGCLTRAITLYWCLRRAGVDVELCFGLGRPGDDYAGHCWLERDGSPYLEPDGAGAHFEVFFRIPGIAS